MRNLGAVRSQVAASKSQVSPRRSVGAGWADRLSLSWNCSRFLAVCGCLLVVAGATALAVFDINALKGHFKSISTDISHARRSNQSISSSLSVSQDGKPEAIKGFTSNQLSPTPQATAIVTANTVAEVEMGSSNILKRASIAKTGDYVMEHTHHQMIVQGSGNNQFPVNYIWSPPAKGGPINGVILLLHGCSAHHLYAWYPTSENCGNCSGRPMEAGIIRELYTHGYATVSTEPFNSKCWNDKKDGAHVAKIISIIFSELNISFATTPLFALGIANAAKFLVNLATETSLFGGYRMAGVICMNGGLWDKPSPVRAYAPMLFIDMARNVELCMQNNLTVHLLKESLPVTTSVEQFTLLPHPMTPTFFSDALVLNEEDSQRLFKNLVEDEVLWPGSYILIDSPFSHMAYKFKDVSNLKCCFRWYSNVQKCRW